MEVVVEFLEGDPDKPLVTGCVYNGKNDVPYELPKHKTRSTFKTDTHQGTGYNELRFEDQNGFEEIRVHAQRDMNTIVLKDATTTVQGNARSVTYGHQTSEILGGAQVSCASGLSLNVGSKNFSTVLKSGTALTGNRSSKMGSKLNRKTGSDMKPGAMTIATDKSANLSSGTDVSVNAGKSASILALGRVVIESVKGMSLRAGKVFRIDASDFAIVRAGSAIEMRAGKSMIRMDKSGKIVISGVDIEITGTSKISGDAPRIDFN